MKWLIAIDPGKTFGWALFCEEKLSGSAHCSQSAFFAGKLSAQAVRTGMKLPPTLDDLPGEFLFVGEKPNYRRAGGSKTSPDDLITLGIFLGELVALYRRKVDTVELVTAHEWKGSLDKDICHKRIQKILRPDEVMPENHNARDAVGIGLWKLGRYRR